MADEKSNFLICDVRFNDRLILDVNLSKTCSLGKLLQGLWEDEKFRSAALSFLKSKEAKDGKETAVNEWPLKSFHSLDRSILRAYVAIRILPTWKWLEFKDFVADFENRKESLTIVDVLGTLCNEVHKPILRIVPKSETEADDREVKTIIQELLTTKSLATLSAAGCPLSKGMLSLIGQDKYTCTISYDKREQFIHWLRGQDLTRHMLAIPEKSTKSPLQPMTPVKIAKSRVTFDPEGEISKLNSWFDKNQRPGKELIEDYTEELNKGRSSKCKRMLTQESIAVWFKNRRAKAKKEENGSPDFWDSEEQQVKRPTMVAVRKLENGGESREIGVDPHQNSLLPSNTFHTTTDQCNIQMSTGKAGICECTTSNAMHIARVTDISGKDGRKDKKNISDHSTENGDWNTGDEKLQADDKTIENGGNETGEQEMEIGHKDPMCGENRGSGNGRNSNSQEVENHIVEMKVNWPNTVHSIKRMKEEKEMGQMGLDHYKHHNFSGQNSKRQYFGGDDKERT